MEYDRRQHDATEYCFNCGQLRHCRMVQFAGGVQWLCGVCGEEVDRMYDDDPCDDPDLWGDA